MPLHSIKDKLSINDTLIEKSAYIYRKALDKRIIKNPAKCYRLLVRNLKLRLPAVDSNVYLTKIANRANVSQKSYRRAIEMLAIINDNPVSYGKDPNALAVATL